MNPVYQSKYILGPYLDLRKIHDEILEVQCLEGASLLMITISLILAMFIDFLLVDRESELSEFISLN